MSSKKCCFVFMLYAWFVVLPCNLVRAQQVLNSDDVAMANRLSFGVNGSLLLDIQAVGTENWLRDQLYPKNDLELIPDIATMIDSFSRLHKSADEQLGEVSALRKKADEAQKAAQAATFSMPFVAGTPGMPSAIPPTSPPLKASQIANNYRSETLSETQMRRVLREIYDKNQLLEQMTWFWFNHFNVLWDKGDTAYRLADYEDHVLRKYALGKFRNLLEADLKHPSMLQYLDNAQNVIGHINENYAREIMELHTMGVGSGYSQADVEALARILTGLSYVPPGQDIKFSSSPRASIIREGDFIFNPARHDFTDKLFLGQVIKGRGFPEVEQALDLIVQQPATAHFICLKLAEFFVADQPPEPLVKAMAKRFRDTDGDIASVLDFLFHSKDFRRSLKQPLLKDPEHYIISAIRLSYEQRSILNAKPVVSWIGQLGEPLYARTTPDGYPLGRSNWNGPGQIEQRFEIARAIGTGFAGLFKPNGVMLPLETPIPQIQDRLYQTGLSKFYSLEIFNILAQAKSQGEWNTLILASPDFMGR